jgi:alpha-D-ribose 1-methylphosphonate 5-phosphate C-P lyase
VVPLAFEDHPFRPEGLVADRCCALCGARGVYLDERVEAGSTRWVCNDTSFCRMRRETRR